MDESVRIMAIKECFIQIIIMLFITIIVVVFFSIFGVPKRIPDTICSTPKYVEISVYEVP